MNTKHLVNVQHMLLDGRTAPEGPAKPNASSSSAWDMAAVRVSLMVQSRLHCEGPITLKLRR